jgi:hypothetical protein
MRWKFVLSDDACGAYAVSNPFFFTSCLHGFGYDPFTPLSLSLFFTPSKCSNSNPVSPFIPFFTFSLSLFSSGG